MTRIGLGSPGDSAVALRYVRVRPVPCADRNTGPPGRAARDNRPVQVAVLGLGLIGGSIARALRAGGGAAEPVERLVAWTPSGAGPRHALAAGVIDATPAGPAETIDGADLVVVAAPPLDCLGLLAVVAGLRGRLAPNAVVTDVASTKERIVDFATGVGLPFVGGHPMAGAEATGFAASNADLFRGRPWVVVPGPSSPADGVERVEALARACGARPMRLDAVTHDRAVAAVSHVPLVVAVALVEAVIGPPGGPDRPDWALEAQLASSGWASMTRLALGSPEMAAGIAGTNDPAIVAGLRDVRAAIDAWILELESEVHAPPLVERFRAARDRLARSNGASG
jgi:prephenate dehydrogenase